LQKRLTDVPTPTLQHHENIVLVMNPVALIHRQHRSAFLWELHCQFYFNWVYSSQNRRYLHPKKYKLCAL